MKKYLIKHINVLLQLFVSSRFVVAVGKKGYGHSYSWKDRHLFFERNKQNNERYGKEQV